MKLKWPQKNPQKQGRILEGGGEFSGWPEYVPLCKGIISIIWLSTLEATATTTNVNAPATSVVSSDTTAVPGVTGSIGKYNYKNYFWLFYGSEGNVHNY